MALLCVLFPDFPEPLLYPLGCRLLQLPGRTVKVERRRLWVVKTLCVCGGEGGSTSGW